jgi:hypothetical protein
MNKITGEHLARSAFVYVRQSTAYQIVNNLEAGGGSMVWWHGHGTLAGKTCNLSTMILADPVVAQSDRDSNAASSG